MTNNLTEKAMGLCKQIHKEIDRDGNPHWMHCFRVAQNIPEFLKPAAYLHDALEDTELAYEEIKSDFGDGVANTVKKLTRGERSWKTYIQAIKKDDLARTIKIYDICDNLSRGGVKNEAKRQSYLWALNYLLS